jgi:hypothetical protein
MNIDVASRFKMSSPSGNKATFAEVFGSIKFSSKNSNSPAYPWPETGFAVNKSTHVGDSFADEPKLVRSSN